MARADKNNLHRSRIEADRNQRQEEPAVAGAGGNEEEHTPEAAEVQARQARDLTAAEPAVAVVDHDRPVRPLVRIEPRRFYMHLIVGHWRARKNRQIASHFMLSAAGPGP